MSFPCTFMDFSNSEFVINTDSPTNDYFSKHDLLKAPSFATAIKNRQIFNESLIASYNVDKFAEQLVKTFSRSRLQIGEINIPAGIDKNLFKGKYNWVFGFVLFIKDFTNQDEKQLKKMLDFFGYHIINRTMYDTTLKATIEPTHPLIINKIVNPLIKIVYHVTLSKNLPKIQKIGLVPKESKTTFTHTGNRIYLLLGRAVNAYMLAQEIAKDRGQKLNDYALLEVKFDTNKYTYYMDQACVDLTANPPVLGCFITNNIPPTDIKIVSQNMALDLI